MSEKIELIVGLKIPDTTAITAFHTLERMGFDKLEKLKREDYYLFETSDNFNNFSKRISKADILVNSNKNKFIVKKQKEPLEDKALKVLVQDIDDGAKSLLLTLKERLGFKDIKTMEKGVLWSLYFDDTKEGKAIAEDITKKLLCNTNYQKYKIL